MADEQRPARLVSYVGGSAVPVFYVLGERPDGAWDVAVLDDAGQVVQRIGPVEDRGTAIRAAETCIDLKAERSSGHDRGRRYER